ncbi:MAG: Phenylalanine-tRNA ligase beta subunit, partial [Candidatus Gottesmanbacteria bacterium GW2011_GWB1_43_11]
QLLTKLEIKTPITVLELEFAQLVKSAQTTKKYQPIPKYPPVIEDMTFVLPAKTPLGEIIAAIKNQSPLVYEVQLITEYQDTATFRIHYLNPDKQITDSEVIALRTQLKEMVDKTFNAKLRG